MKKLQLLICLIFASRLVVAQTVFVQGYTYAANNSGYIGQADILISSPDMPPLPGGIASSDAGQFNIQLPAGKTYNIVISKSGFKTLVDTFSTVGKADGEKLFLKFPIERSLGYILEGTLSEYINASALSTVDTSGRPVAVNAIDGATIEIYNNTTQKEELRLPNHEAHTFSFNLEQGNQYIVLIRKKNYFNKWIKINVNVNGCILCAEGIGTLTPGVVDNLTRSNTMGTLGANITLKKIELDKGIKIENILYNSGKWDIREDAKPSLDNIVKLMKENPGLVVELRSHTDCRGTDEENLILSQHRAQSAVDYIIENGGVMYDRIKAKGYGEEVPLNKCVDDVPCTEAEWQQNRRTEFAVVDFNADPYEGRSLRSIMAERYTNDLLKTFEKSITAVHKADKNKAASATTPKGKDAKAVTPPISQPDIKLPKIGDAEMFSVGYEAPAFDSSALSIDAGTNTTSAIETPKVTEPTVVVKDVPKDTLPKVVEVTVETPKVVVETPKVTEPTVVVKDIPKDTLPKVVEVAETPRVDIPYPRYVLEHKVPNYYTGFKIELFAVDAPLSADDALFKAYNRVMTDYTEQNTISYMIGDFIKRNLAEDYLTSILKTKYPLAKVVQYQAGQRLN